MEDRRSKIIFTTIFTASAACAVYAFYRHVAHKFSWFRRRFVCPQVYVCNSAAEWHALQNQHLKTLSNPLQVVGLDCEWMAQRQTNEPRRPVALLQLALPSDVCILVRLCKFKTAEIPVGLIEILSNSGILKVGVGINLDTQYLQKDYNLNVQGALDLRFIIDSVPELSSIKKKGLQGLAEEVLGIKLQKSKKVIFSDWEADVLSDEQIDYAANDAAVSLCVFLESMRRHLQKGFFQTMFSSPATVEEMVQSALALHNNVVNVSYDSIKSRPPSSEKNSIFDPIQKKKPYTRSYCARTRPLYQNCQLQAPDGEVLCTCDSKKALWYVQKELGVVISEEPLVVRLNFEPAGRPMLDGFYYVQEKENICVVCGEKNSFVRKIVVPHEYRKYFPPIMKNHLSHDVLLLCLHCHQQSNLYDSRLRLQLAEECGAPVGTEEEVKSYDDPQLKKVKSAARAIKLSKEKLPATRLEELTSIVKDYYQVDELTEDVLEKAANATTSILNEDYVSHGLKVVQYKEKHGGLVAFERTWRQHFLDTMKPKFLPRMWSVDHNHQRLSLAKDEKPKTNGIESKKA